MIVWNHGKKLITIVIDDNPSPAFGAGHDGVRYFIGPGQGINLSIVKLLPKKPKNPDSTAESKK